ncbi:CBS domain-containing protein [Nocardiopsis sp. EMB25]|uniref:CBS domain-containing protein n=1 Tax=Nocardiopsis TaxID=2013 RepID=UPI000346C60E|nr:MULTISPECIES: CBS domain-containing protein [Nocardiopsis]MCY9787032.1 CBS domain-containing protein [Nocardiopsis sp. EMB25]
MTTAADIMHTGVKWAPANESLDRIAEMMREQGVGAIPIADADSPDERMCGIITDRDIVLECIAQGHDPARVTAGELCKGTPRWVSTSAGVDEILREMESHQIRRLPVVDENKRLVGMITEADLAHHLTNDKIAEFVGRVYA